MAEALYYGLVVAGEHADLAINTVRKYCQKHDISSATLEGAHATKFLAADDTAATLIRIPVCEETTNHLQNFMQALLNKNIPVTQFCKVDIATGKRNFLYTPQELDDLCKNPQSLQSAEPLRENVYRGGNMAFAAVLAFSALAPLMMRMVTIRPDDPSSQVLGNILLACAVGQALCSAATAPHIHTAAHTEGTYLYEARQAWQNHDFGTAALKTTQSALANLTGIGQRDEHGEKYETRLGSFVERVAESLGKHTGRGDR